ncbi:SLC13 family permease [Weissella hellenica]|uniref:Carboxylate transporter n=2 Tax=Weissella hellenica TaxID=46256 RepID=A0A7X6RDF8_WEIHE|nr:SLC13 family permease [Weissella hellenica]NKY67184.1 carboxylate transporter [Weissella hellenica]SCC01445.1 Na+/H+ antiporter NhaD [Weissella hellenica]
MPVFISKIINDRTLWITSFLLVLMLIFGSVEIQDIDFQTIGALLSLMILIGLFEKEGLLKYIAVIIIKKCQTTRQVQLTVFLLVFFGAMLLTNDVAILTFIPIFIVIAQKINIKPVLPIILLTIFANLGSSVTPFGNPQNIFLANYYHLGAGTFFKMALPLGALSLTFLLLSGYLFKSTPLENLTLTVPDIRVKQTILLLIGSVIVLAGLLHLLPIFVSLITSIILTIIINYKNFVTVDYGIIILFVELFLIVGGLSRVPMIVSLFKKLTTTELGAFASGVGLSQVISNVPAAVLLSAFTGHMYAVYLGVSIGGLGTIIASLANLLAWRQYQQQTDHQSLAFPLKLMLVNLIFLVIFVLIGVGLLMISH